MNNVTAPKEYKLSKRNTYYIFTLLFLLYFFDYVDRMIVTSLFPYIQKEWGLTDTQSGLLVSVVYWSIVAFVFPVSILVDRWSRKKTIGIMALLWRLATVACAFTKSFPQLLMARSGIGIGEAGYAPAGTAMLSGLFPPEKRSRMMGLWNMSIPLGIAVGIGVGGFVAQHWGWRHAFGLVALPGAIVAILFFFVKDYKTVELVKTVDSAIPARAGQDEQDGYLSRVHPHPIPDFDQSRVYRVHLRQQCHHRLASHLFSPCGRHPHEPGGHEDGADHDAGHHRPPPGRMVDRCVVQEAGEFTTAVSCDYDSPECSCPTAHLFDGYWEDVGRCQGVPRGEPRPDRRRSAVRFPQSRGGIYTRMRILPASRITRHRPGGPVPGQRRLRRGGGHSAPTLRRRRAHADRQRRGD